LVWIITRFTVDEFAADTRSEESLRRFSVCALPFFGAAKVATGATDAATMLIMITIATRVSWLASGQLLYLKSTGSCLSYFNARAKGERGVARAVS